MADRIVDRATPIIKPIVEELGYVFVDLEYKKDVSGYVLALTIDKEQGVNIDDCERVSRALDEPLDVLDVTDGKSYNFNVSSYGLDRQFKTDYDFNKHLNKLVDIKFYAPFKGMKNLTAKLIGFDNSKIIVEYNNENIDIERKIIARICANIVF